MKTLGMIGGVGPESTIDYYKNIIALHRERKPDGHYPQFVINSIDLQEGIELVVPEPKDQDYIHEKYFAELVPGIFLPETRENLLAIADRMKDKMDIEGVLLAGTELALILRGESHNGVALLDTGKIHCQAAVNEMFS